MILKGSVSIPKPKNHERFIEIFTDVMIKRFDRELEMEVYKTSDRTLKGKPNFIRAFRMNKVIFNKMRFEIRVSDGKLKLHYSLHYWLFLLFSLPIHCVILSDLISRDGYPVLSIIAPPLGIFALLSLFAFFDLLKIKNQIEKAFYYTQLFTRKQKVPTPPQTGRKHRAPIRKQKTG